MANSILVLGMHRSGTSLTAELLNRCGAYGGEPGDMPSPTIDNPSGYWEYLPLVKFNDELLAAAHSAWYVPPADSAQLRGWANDDSLRKKALSLIESMSGNGRIWYWKDPRMPLLLPFWSDFLSDSTIIIPLRNPLEIIASLKKRENRNNGKDPTRFPASAILLLWQYSMLNILSFIDQCSNVFLFQYENLIRDPQSVTSSLCAFLDRRHGTHAAASADFIAQAVKPDLRRNRSSDVLDNARFATSEQINLWHYLCERASHSQLPFHPDAYPLYKGWREYLQIIESLTIHSYNTAKSSNALFAQLFIDTGSGFNEADSFVQPLSPKENCFLFNLQMYSAVRRIRFDPCNKEAVLRINNISLILINGQTSTIAQYDSNAILKDKNLLVFSGDDPFILFEHSEAGGRIQTIRFDLEYVAIGAPAQPLIIDKQGHHVQELRTRLQYMEDDISRAHDLIRFRDHELSEKDLVINQKKQELAQNLSEKDLVIKQKEQELAQKNEYISRLVSSPSWRLTAPLRWLRRKLVRLLDKYGLQKLFRSRLYFMRLMPAHDLEPAADSYRITGPDPQFMLESSNGTQPHGWVRLSYEASSPDMVLTPKLYMLFGSSLSEQYDGHVQLPKVSAGHNVHILHIPKRTAMLRLDPVELASGLFSFSNVHITEIGYARLACAISTACFKAALVAPACLTAMPGRLWTLVSAKNISGLQHVLLHHCFPDKATSKQSFSSPVASLKKLLRRAHLLREYKLTILRYKHLARTNKPLADLDIIIPAYRGFTEMRACLESVLQSKNSTAFDIIVIDDASPEPELSAFLRELSDRGEIILLKNVSNHGFVSSVNLGMCLHPDRDVILLNSDTVVANDWVDRLRACAFSHPRCATVSPMTNRGTICSYPVNCADNDLPPHIRLAELDLIFAEQNHSACAEAPTSVGFCMFIKRAAIRDIGIFDAQLFGTGYGEENDFCMRALHRRWKHFICASVFVEHHGSVSFLDQKGARCREAIKLMNDLYPDYLCLVSEHCSRDPLRSARLRVEAALIRFAELPKILFVNHNWGGGTDTHVRELGALYSTRACMLLATAHKNNPSCFDLFTLPHGQPLNLPSQGLTYDEMVALLRTIEFDRIHFHHTIGMDRRIYSLPKDLQCPYDVTVHDYFSICPRVNMVDAAMRYCGGPHTDSCDRCISQSPAHGIDDVVGWRKNNCEFICGAHRVFCPTHHVANTLSSHFPHARVIMAAHPDAEKHDLAQRPVWSHTAGEPLRIALLGVINDFKGRNVIAAAAHDAEEKRLPLLFTLLGDEHGERALTNIPRMTVTGRYKPADLMHLLQEVQPHIVWFPAQCPETYSYTLSEAFRFRLPVATTDLGALAERTEGRALSWSLPWATSSADWNNFFCRLQAGDMAEDLATAAKPHSQPPISFRYSTDYLPAESTRAYTDLRMSNTTTVGAIVTTHADMRPDPCAMIRVLLPLRHHCIEDRLAVRMLSPLQTLKHRTDYLLVQRTALPDMTTARLIVEHCHALQIRMLYETDDDLFMMTAEHPEYNHYSHITAPARYYIEHAYAVIVSTQYLRERLAALHPLIHVIPNAIDELLWAAAPDAGPPTEPPANPIRILYMGTLSHHNDLQILKKTIKRLKKHFGKAVVFETVGVTDREKESWFDQIQPPEDTAGNYERFVPWLLEQRRWHIGVAPLTSTEFNQCKSFLKYVDYAALGCCGVFSDCLPYRGAVTHERNGLLVENTHSQWFEALKRLIEDDALRSRLRSAAYRDLTERHTLEAQYDSRRTFWLNLKSCPIDSAQHKPPGLTWNKYATL